ncbi:MAG: DUF3592 domain-containing protein [Lachnospiraceae bacterium]|nr:DUF3592 domain-containing protein [Lachnospiraceae bacterium]
MKEFLTQNFEWVIGAAFLLVFMIYVVHMMKKAKRIDREGITADGVVTRVEHDCSADSGDTYTTYVEYRDEKGELHESVMSMNSVQEFRQGEKLRIRYIPGEYKYARPVK